MAGAWLANTAIKDAMIAIKTRRDMRRVKREMQRQQKRRQN